MLKLSNFSKKGSMKMISTLNEIIRDVSEDNDTIIITDMLDQILMHMVHNLV